MSIFQFGLLLVALAPFGLAFRLAHLNQGSARISPPVDDIDDFAGILAPRIYCNPEIISLEREAWEEVAALQAIARARLVRVQLAITPGTKVYADRDALRAVLRTILRAAIRATPCGQVLMTAATTGAACQIRITDDGAADPKAREDLACELETSIAPTGGSIAVEATEGRGTTVMIELLSRVQNDKTTPIDILKREPADQFL